MKIIKISAMWCPACLIMNKIWKKIKEEYPDIEIVNLDYDIDSLEVEKYEPGKILPVIIFIDKDKEVNRLIGEMSIEKIRSEIDKYVKQY